MLSFYISFFVFISSHIKHLMEQSKYMYMCVWEEDCIKTKTGKRGSNGCQESCFFLNYEVKKKKDKSRIRNTPKAIFLSNLILFCFFFIVIFFKFYLCFCMWVCMIFWVGWIAGEFLSEFPRTLKCDKEMFLLDLSIIQIPFL